MKSLFLAVSVIAAGCGVEGDPADEAGPATPDESPEAGAAAADDGPTAPEAHPEPEPEPEPAPEPEPGAVDDGSVEPDVEAEDVPPPDPDVADDPPAAPVDCEPIAAQGFSLCASRPDSCEAVFEDGAGCAAVCGAAQLVCLRSHEDIDDRCAPDLGRPALPCAGVGHRSDYCVCGRADCEPSCAGRECGPDGCGGSCGECEGEGAAEVLCGPDGCPAFPGAEGFGAQARGGRGGDVCVVSSLSDDGGSTLRRCLTRGDDPRTVVFEVAGIIDLRSPLVARRDRLTLAGQTAPGGGVTIRGY